MSLSWCQTRRKLRLDFRLSATAGRPGWICLRPQAGTGANCCQRHRLKKHPGEICAVLERRHAYWPFLAGTSTRRRQLGHSAGRASGGPTAAVFAAKHEMARQNGSESHDASRLDRPHNGRRAGAFSPGVAQHAGPPPAQLACCRLRGRKDPIVTEDLEEGCATLDVPARDQDQGHEDCDGAGRGCGRERGPERVAPQDGATTALAEPSFARAVGSDLERDAGARLVGFVTTASKGAGPRITPEFEKAWSAAGAGSGRRIRRVAPLPHADNGNHP